MEIEYACMASKAGSTFELSVGDQSIPGTVESTGSWSEYRTFELGSILVSSTGTVQVGIKPIEMPAGAVMNLRAVRLAPADK